MQDLANAEKETSSAQSELAKGEDRSGWRGPLRPVAKAGQGRGRKQKEKDAEEPEGKNDSETHLGHDAGPKPENAGDEQDQANAEEETSSAQSELAKGEDRSGRRGPLRPVGKRRGQKQRKAADEDPGKEDAEVSLGLRIAGLGMEIAALAGITDFGVATGSMAEIKRIKEDELAQCWQEIKTTG